MQSNLEQNVGECEIRSFLFTPSAHFIYIYLSRTPLSNWDINALSTSYMRTECYHGANTAIYSVHRNQDMEISLANETLAPLMDMPLSELILRELRHPIEPLKPFYFNHRSETHHWSFYIHTNCSAS